MEFSHEEVGGVVVVHLSGENLGSSEAPSFKEKIIHCITSYKNPNVVFDLETLQFIDSSGLGSFLAILRFVRSQQGELKLARMAKPVSTMFQIVRMRRLFEIYPSTAEAVASFGTLPLHVE